MHYLNLFYFVLAVLLLLLLFLRNKRQRNKTTLLAKDELQAKRLALSLDTTYLQLHDISFQSWVKVTALLKTKKELAGFTIHKVYEINSDRYLFVTHHESKTLSLDQISLADYMPSYTLSAQEQNINFLLAYEESLMSVTCRSVLYDNLDEKLVFAEFCAAVRTFFDSSKI